MQQLAITTILRQQLQSPVSIESRLTKKRNLLRRALFIIFLAGAMCGVTSSIQAQTFGDDFNDNSLNAAKWTIFNSASQTTVHEQNSRLEIAVTGPSGSAGGNGVDSASLDLTNHWVALELISRGATTPNASDGFYLRINDNNYFEFYTTDSGYMIFAQKTAGAFDYSYAPYNATNMRFLRWRHVSSTNTIYWETSPTGLDGSWTTQRQVTPQIALTALQLRFSLYANQFNNQSLLVAIDNVTSNVPFAPPNTPPTVSITSPTNNATFDVNSNITINANAADSDGTVSKVEFFQGTTKLGETTSAPFNFTWNNVSAGNYSLTAKATDSGGASTTSSAVNVTVNTKISGKVTRTDGLTPIAGATVKVYQGSTLTNTVNANNSGDYVVTGLAAGTYTVEASANSFVTTNQSVTAPSTSGATANFSLIASNTAGINYHYDELGRLIAVVDPSSDTARYAYDATGNLLSIARSNSSQTSIISFTPKAGLSGTTVAISGTGFSATPSQNTVLFNGVAASVTSSTSSQIVTTVPSGATTGTITVTTPSGSATSSSSFTVSGVAGAPTVSSFTPSIGNPGTSLTITGTNFETVAANNKLKVNSILSDVSSSTSTSIGSSIPKGGSGRITVSTPMGIGVSSADLYIPPSPYGAADVGFTGRMNIGDSQTVSINTANKIGMMLFDGTAGQRVSFKFGTTTMAQVSFWVYDPRGIPIPFYENLNPSESLNLSSGVSSKFVDTLPLQYTGTYMIFVNPSSSTGNLPIRIYDVAPDVSNSATIDGAAAAVTITTPGQNGKLFFDGTAGQKISLTTSNTTLTGSIQIYNPYNGTLGPGASMLSGSESFIDQQTLPYTGRYTIVVDPTGESTGTTNIALHNAADVTGSITPGGAAVSQSISSPGQNIRLSFSGTAGQRVSLNVASGTLHVYTMSILKPDGSTQATYSVPSGFSGGYTDAQTLPADGTYTVLIDGYGANTGGVTATLYDVPADITGTTSIGGPAVPITISTPGQKARLTFDGTSGQQVTVHVTSNTVGSVTVTLLKPDGTQLSTIGLADTNFNLGPQTLPATGTYTIVIDPYNNTGGLSVNVTNP